MLTVCVDLGLGSKHVKFQIISSLLYTITVGTFLVDPHSIQYKRCSMKPSNIRCLGTTLMGTEVGHVMCD